MLLITMNKSQQGCETMYEIINSIKKALENGELQAYYQPQYDSITNRLKSAEALVRWIKKDGTIVCPAEFIPLLEKTNNITFVDWYMFEEVCKLLKQQIDSNSKPVPVSVNFSRIHVRDTGFVAKLCEIADKYDISHNMLEIEITESAMVNESDKIMSWISDIRNAGFSVAIDDFGSGLSSLSFAKDMPADVLKIDKSLLSGNCQSEKERIVLESIFYFANRLNLTTVAEGVETRQQLEFLRSCDCKKIQGFIFAKPMPADQYIELCRNHKKIEKTTDILQIQTPASTANLLMNVIFQRYPLVIFANLTRNSFYMMAYDNFTTTSCPAAGVFTELIEHGASSMHPDDQKLFADTFNLDTLLAAYKEGKTEVRLVTRQLGDDGIYRRVETSDYFVKSASSDDILVITLCETLD